MSNTLSVSLTVEYKDDTTGMVLDQLPAKRQTISLTSNVSAKNTQNIGTTHEALSLGDVATDGGPVWAINRDQTNYVEIGLVVSASFVPFCKLMPNSPPMLLPGVSSRALYAKANTAACDLLYFISNP